MAESGNVLKKIQEKMAEKEEVIEEQMAQIVDLEDKLAASQAEAASMRQELEWLREIKSEYDKLKKQLDSLLGE